MKKKKEVKYKIFDTAKLKKTEFFITLIIGIVFLITLGISICNNLFIPITLVMFSLFLFSICYYYINDKDKRKLVYLLFFIGVIFIVIEVIYTLVNVL